MIIEEKLWKTNTVECPVCLLPTKALMRVKFFLMIIFFLKRAETYHLLHNEPLVITH